MALSAEDRTLLSGLRSLHAGLRQDTRERFRRLNPFWEDVVDWKELGRFWSAEDRGITLYGSTTVVGDVEIGDGTWIGPFVSLDGTGGLTIGTSCAVSLGAQILSHDTARSALSGGVMGYDYAPTMIGDFCFVGTHAVVTKGVRVGDRSLIAAGAVVTSDVAPMTIVGGIPAEPIGRVVLEAEGTVRLEYRDP